MAKDWVGNVYSTYTTNGARNYAKGEREQHDYYATDPKAIDFLLENETFNKDVWECACGELHLSNRLKEFGYNVKNTDLIIRGEDMSKLDFLKYTPETLNQRDIITNPPYKYAKEFVEHAIAISEPGVKIAMFLKLTFLEGQKRYELFSESPPKTLYVFSKRITCAKNGNFNNMSGAVAYGWYIWEVGWKGNPIIKWII